MTELKRQYGTGEESRDGRSKMEREKGLIEIVGVGLSCLICM